MKIGIDVDNTITETIPVFEYKHNNDCNGKNIIKVKTWEDVYKVIKEIEKLKK